MLFKLSWENMKKSVKDYNIYFLTLVLGVAIFYMFNSIDSQQAMLQVTQSQRDLIKLMVKILGYISIFVAVILALLIVYANKFLINRRKKEFGIYMTLGMSKGQISKIILLETIFVGIISLAVGLVMGIFGSQFMSILVAKMFEADMTKFQFVFSLDSCIKTCIYFAIMYLFVIIFNTITISRYKLINLINASKKNEKVKIRTPYVSILVFIIGAYILGYAYWKVTADIHSLKTDIELLVPILMGTAGTILVFWSLSGFVLQIIKKIRKTYLRGTNMFVLRQINNKINTTVVSMSVICIMLFMTITILSSSLSLRNTIQANLKEMTPVDINIFKTANIPETYAKYERELDASTEQIEDSKITIKETLENNGLDMNVLKDIVEIPIYSTKELTWHDSFGNYYETVQKNDDVVIYDNTETIIKISDYNKIAKLYGLEEYTLNNDEYIVICDYEKTKNMRDEALKNGDTTIKINGKEYHSKYDECKDGYIQMSAAHVNMGIILVPDECNLKEEWKEEYLLAANYNAKNDEEKREIEKLFNIDSNEESKFAKSIQEKGIKLEGVSKISIIDSSVGLTTIVTFIAIYLGIIFLIASSAILALKQLTESSDNKQRYTILRKIGCDEKMINQALFKQIGIFFSMPLILAIIHSIFGIKFVLTVLSGIASSKDLLPSIVATVIIIGVIYGAYFLATYFGSKNIIKEEE